MISIADIPIDALRDAARRSEVITAMKAFYEGADREIAGHNATCWNSGECCRFGQYGHRLYVTALEVAYFLANISDHEDNPDHSVSETAEAVGSTAQIALPLYENGHVEADTCPYAYEGKCHARDCRPLGCRVYYCDPAAQGWQGPMTETSLSRLRAMHEELNVPYFYADWMSVLAALNSAARQT